MGQEVHESYINGLSKKCWDKWAILVRANEIDYDAVVWFLVIGFSFDLYFNERQETTLLSII